MTRYSQSCAHGTGRSVARWPSKLTISLVLVAVHHFTAAAAIHAEADVAYVSQQAGADSGTLLDALRHDSISHIIVQQPVYDVRSEFATYQGKPLTVDRYAGPSAACMCLVIAAKCLCCCLCRKQCTTQCADAHTTNSDLHKHIQFHQHAPCICTCALYASQQPTVYSALHPSLPAAADALLPTIQEHNNLRR